MSSIFEILTFQVQTFARNAFAVFFAAFFAACFAAFLISFLATFFVILPMLVTSLPPSLSGAPITFCKRPAISCKIFP